MGGFYGHFKRPRWVMKYLKKQNASDVDIVITVDGYDVIACYQEKYEKAVEYFMQNTAERKEKFSEEDIIKSMYRYVTSSLTLVTGKKMIKSYLIY
ncbi:hypothetical protein DPX39_070011900 [Trypanosoma brucei equiperdum]|uniref:Uncharacterized protein n=1 Tax=Trypanosoma brucei equiperdum TaxID=630700 RepID=A0A3L6L846_9TRYP|nr:hypothetical protein DPX39_070011900 [Trypanosoma brucei equiperdum]